MRVYPFSPKIIDTIKSELDDFEHSKGLVRFTVEKPFPKSLIETMINLRCDHLENS